MSETDKKPKIILDKITGLGILVTIILLGGLIYGMISNSTANNSQNQNISIAPSDTVLDTPSQTPTNNPTSIPTTQVNTSFSDGTYEVGKDIQPSTYRTKGIQGYSCVWQRLSGFGGSENEVIEENTANGPTLVTIESTDKGFESQYCGTWVKE